MQYRLCVIFLLSLLFVSFSFNCIHYDAMVRAEYMNKFDNKAHATIIEQLHTRLNEIES